MVTAEPAHAFLPEPALVVAGLRKDHGGGRGVLGADFCVPRGSVRCV